MNSVIIEYRTYFYCLTLICLALFIIIIRLPKENTSIKLYQLLESYNYYTKNHLFNNYSANFGFKL